MSIKLKITGKTEKDVEFYCDAYKFEHGFLVISNPKENEKSKPYADGIYLSLSEVKILEVKK